MNRIAGSPGAVLFRELKRRYVPVVTTLLAILLGLFPLVVTSPLLPDIGFLVLLTWRLLRPEIWLPLAALGFGLFDDFVSGHPIGQSMALWTTIFLALDVIEHRIDYKDFWFDWFYAAVAIFFHAAGAWYIGVLMGSHTPFSQLLPPIAFTILAYPMMARLVLGLDRWRLSR
ncbi:MAG TPA: rod shape-determining protein MreD [Allosphingosinicella sp.]|jgi:rod shape-determining protein MreD|nr:rod shape-determining protein MreD [Allosphingosinicella sp.]